MTTATRERDTLESTRQRLRRLRKQENEVRKAIARGDVPTSKLRRVRDDIEAHELRLEHLEREAREAEEEAARARAEQRLQELARESVAVVERFAEARKEAPKLMERFLQPAATVLAAREDHAAIRLEARYLAERYGLDAAELPPAPVPGDSEASSLFGVDRRLEAERKERRRRAEAGSDLHAAWSAFKRERRNEERALEEVEKAGAAVEAAETPGRRAELEGASENARRRVEKAREDQARAEKEIGAALTRLRRAR